MMCRPSFFLEVCLGRTTIVKEGTKEEMSLLGTKV